MSSQLTGDFGVVDWPQMRFLSLHGPNLTTLRCGMRLPSIEYLNVRGQFPIDDVERIVDLGRLRFVRIVSPRLDDAALMRLHSMQLATRVVLDGSFSDDSVLELLDHLPQATRVWLSSDRITSALISEVKQRHGDLRFFRVDRPNATVEGWGFDLHYKDPMEAYFRQRDMSAW